MKKRKEIDKLVVATFNSASQYESLKEDLPEGAFALVGTTQGDWVQAYKGSEFDRMGQNSTETFCTLPDVWQELVVVFYGDSIREIIHHYRFLGEIWRNTRDMKNCSGEFLVTTNNEVKIACHERGMSCHVLGIYWR